jgi:hypothetical protein
MMKVGSNIAQQRFSGIAKLHFVSHDVPVTDELKRTIATEVGKSMSNAPLRLFLQAFGKSEFYAFPAEEDMVVLTDNVQGNHALEYEEALDYITQESGYYPGRGGGHVMAYQVFKKMLLELQAHILGQIRPEQTADVIVRLLNDSFVAYDVRPRPLQGAGH